MPRDDVLTQRHSQKKNRETVRLLAQNITIPKHNGDAALTDFAMCSVQIGPETSLVICGDGYLETVKITQAQPGHQLTRHRTVTQTTHQHRRQHLREDIETDVLP